MIRITAPVKPVLRKKVFSGSGGDVITIRHTPLPAVRIMLAPAALPIAIFPGPGPLGFGNGRAMRFSAVSSGLLSIAIGSHAYMEKTIFVFCLVFFATLPVFAQSNQAESLTISTYYPSPYGSYDRLQTRRLAMGDRNNDGKLTDADLPPNDGQLYMGRSVIYQPLNPFPAVGIPGELGL